jgi:GABA permease
MRDPESVYRVVRIVATDDHTWEAAASSGIGELAKTIDDLRVARVTERDVVVREGRAAVYRVKLEATYRIDRQRSTAAGATLTVRRYLVVANESVGSETLEQAIAARLALGPAEFHVLVPATLRGWPVMAGIAEPSAGIAMINAVDEATRQEAYQQAGERMRDQMNRLAAAGARATGEIGSPDPIAAIAAVLERSSFDEILVAAPAAALSKWLKLDLPSRIERRFHVKVAQLPAGH